MPLSLSQCGTGKWFIAYFQEQVSIVLVNEVCLLMTRNNSGPKT